MANTSGLRRGGPGRPKGLQNKATREIKQFCQEFLTSPEYVEAAKRRVKLGKAPHLETLWHQYAFGKPREQVDVSVTGLLAAVSVARLTDDELTHALRVQSRLLTEHSGD